MSGGTRPPCACEVDHPQQCALERIRVCIDKLAHDGVSLPLPRLAGLDGRWRVHERHRASDEILIHVLVLLLLGHGVAHQLVQEHLQLARAVDVDAILQPERVAVHSPQRDVVERLLERPVDVAQLRAFVGKPSFDDLHDRARRVLLHERAVQLLLVEGHDEVGPGALRHELNRLLGGQRGYAADERALLARCLLREFARPASTRAGGCARVREKAAEEQEKPWRARARRSVCSRRHAP